MMGLILTGKRDHALLALVVQEATALCQASGGYVGRTALQKVMYFLEALGVPMRYQFDLYHYGPFCDEVSHDVEWLLADGVLVDRSTAPGRYSAYAPGPALAELVDKYQVELGPLREKVRSVLLPLLPLRPEHLELVATLDYAYRELWASGKAPAKEAVLARFRAFKGDRFAAEEVARAYEKLAEARLWG
jgi:hypothetical protein